MRQSKNAATQQFIYNGRFLELEAAGQYGPIILGVGRLKDWGSFENFQQAVMANYPERQAEQWLYRSLQGHVLEMPHDLGQLSRIDGQPLPADGQTDAELGPNMGMHSPFLKSVYNSGRVALTVDGHTHTIDFV